MKSIAIHIFLSVALFCLSACQPSPSSSNDQQITFSTAPLTFVTQQGARHAFTVEVAKTPEQLMHGFMFRETLDDDKGMIFLFSDSQQRGFWMKNTYIFLDIIFVDEQGRIVKIHPMAQPHDETLIPSQYPAKAVVEIKGGMAEKLNIIAGDHIEFKSF